MVPELVVKLPNEPPDVTRYATHVLQVEEIFTSAGEVKPVS
jgi:hypothetical protein